MAKLTAYYQFNIDDMRLKTYIKKFESDKVDQNVNNPWEDNYTIFADSIDAAIELLGSDFGRDGKGNMVRGTVEGLSEWFWGGDELEWTEIYNLTNVVEVTSRAFYEAFQTHSTVDDFALWETMLSGNDRIFLSSFDDTANGYAGRDKMYGYDGRDILRGGDDKDILYGGNDNDKLLGENGNDKLVGGDNNDRLKGGDGKDKLYGGDNNDTLRGGEGDDLIRGGAGRDKEYGGDGEDTFQFKAGDEMAIIGDFDAKGLEHDILDLRGVASIRNWKDLSENHMSKDGKDVVIDANNGDVIVLKGVSMNTLDKGDFLFS